MSIVKDLKKQHKKLETEIKKLTKTRLNDRSSSSWKSLKELKKRKLQLKDKIAQLAQQVNRKKSSKMLIPGFYF